MKKAIIIGASSGIGREVANLLIDEGWAVGVAARREDKLNELKAKARQLFNLTSATDGGQSSVATDHKTMFNLASATDGGKPSVVESACIDVTSDDAPAQLRALINRLGGMDLFFYASGIGKVNLQLQTDIELATVETNVVGFTRMIGAAYHYFAEAGGGHIAAISSIAGTMGLGPAPAYSASKAMQSTYLQAIEQLIYQQKLPIHITDIRPGFVNTALLTGQHYPMMLSPQKVARKIVQAINHKKHVCIIDWKYRLLTLLWRCIPKWLWRRLPLMRKRITLLISAMMVFMAVHGQSFPVISENATTGCFPLVEHGKAATICTDTED